MTKRLPIIVTVALLLAAGPSELRAQVIGTEPTPIAMYNWDSGAGDFVQVTTAKTSGAYQNAPQPVVFTSFNVSLGQWVPVNAADLLPLSGVGAGSYTCANVTVAGTGIVTAAANGTCGATSHAVTFNNTGSGAASGTTFDGSVARTISYNTLGAQHAISFGTSGTSGASTFDGTNLNIPVYQGHIALTTAGSSGAATFDGSTLNIPQYSFGATPNAITFNNTGSGAASGTTFDGSVARTISYNTLGAQHAISFGTTGTSGASTFDGTNLNIPIYQGHIALTTIGASGAATFDGSTLNIPQYSGSVTTTCNANGCFQLYPNGTIIAWGISSLVAGTPVQTNVSITYPTTFTNPPTPVLTPVSDALGGGGPCTGGVCAVVCHVIRSSISTSGATLAIGLATTPGGSGFASLATGDYCAWTAMGS